MSVMKAPVSLAVNTKECLGLVRVRIFRKSENIQPISKQKHRLNFSKRCPCRRLDIIDDQVDLAIRITDRPSPGLMGRRLR